MMVELHADPFVAARQLLTLGVAAVLSGQRDECSRLLAEFPPLPVDSEYLWRRVWALALEAWLRVLRDGHGDSEAVRLRCMALRMERDAIDPRELLEIERHSHARLLAFAYDLAEAASALNEHPDWGAGNRQREEADSSLTKECARVWGTAHRARVKDFKRIAEMVRAIGLMLMRRTEDENPNICTGC
jgi:hypothetical protein